MVQVTTVDTEEEELQEALGTRQGRVKWTFGLKPRVRKHDAAVHSLLGGEEGDVVVVCRCGWAMRFDKKVKLDKSADVFMRHLP